MPAPALGGEVSAGNIQETESGRLLRAGQRGTLLQPVVPEIGIAEERVDLEASRVEQARCASCDGRLARGRSRLYPVRMKRTNLVLNEELLEEAVRLSGEKTYSGTVTKALEDYVRRAKARQILELRGSGHWKGNLSKMRDDRTRRRESA